MAQILVQGPSDLQSTAIRDALIEQIREDGHDATTVTHFPTSIDECDAVIVLADRADAKTGAVAGYATGRKKPVLALHSGPLPEGFQAESGRADSVEGWFQLLPKFYDDIRPFAGRLVRDLIPQLVKDAGHNVQFRALDDSDKPRFLKQKVVDEAHELLHAEMGEETEEVGDVLEALEALIRVRDYGRENLRRVKDGKKKRRGGFERCWVVEATNQPEPQAETSQPAPSQPERQTEFFEV